MTRVVLERLTVALGLAAFLSVSDAKAQAPGPSPTKPASPSESLTLRFGVEYWVRATRIVDFDFDGASNDGLNFGWQRVKPFFGGRKRWFEFALQGQDARSHGVPAFNPNGSSTFASRTSQLDFVKAFVKIAPSSQVSVKVGREQADGIDVGISRKLASSSNYGTVLKSFDLVSVRWEDRGSSLMGFAARPVDNRPYQINKRHRGEAFVGVQGTRTIGKNTHRLYAIRRSVGADGPASEIGSRRPSQTYAVGFQETGPLVFPGVTWEAEGILEWGHRSTDRLRAAATFVTATRAFSPNQSVFVGYHQASGDGVRGDGTTHLFDTLYSSGFNNYGYMGLSQGRNIADLRLGGTNKIAGPASVLWAYHEQFLSVRNDVWYAIFTPNVSRTGARSARLGREVDATLLLRFRVLRHATIGLSYLAFQPGGYLRTTGPHKTAQQFAIDIYGQF